MAPRERYHGDARPQADPHRPAPDPLDPPRGLGAAPDLRVLYRWRGERHGAALAGRSAGRAAEARPPPLRRPPMPMGSLEDELLPRWIALPIFASDPLSSVAYATEAALVVLVATSACGLARADHPDLGGHRGAAVGGGAVVPADDLRLRTAADPTSWRRRTSARCRARGGRVAVGRLRAHSRRLDRVGRAGGHLGRAGALPHAVELVLGVLVVLMVVNLRGVRESGFVFALPTYGFIIAIGA